MKQLLIMFLLGHILISDSHAIPPGVKHIAKPWQAPAIDLVDNYGNRHNIIDYHGRILIVNFWGTWCRPCRKEMPSLQRAHEQLIKQNISIIAIAMGDSQSDVKLFNKKYPVDFPLIADSENKVSDNWFVSALPTSYIINQKGEVIIRVIGDYEWDDPDFIKKIIALKK